MASCGKGRVSRAGWGTWAIWGCGNHRLLAPLARNPKLPVQLVGNPKGLVQLARTPTVLVQLARNPKLLVQMAGKINFRKALRDVIYLVLKLSKTVNGEKRC